MSLTVLLLEVGSGVFGFLGEGDGLLNGAVGGALQELIVYGVLDRVDECLFGQWFEEQGRCVHLAAQGGLEVEQFVAQDWGGCE